MYTPEEITQIFEAYNNAIKAGTPISRELSDQMKDAVRGIKNYNQELRSSGLAFKRSMGDLVSSMAQGSKGASQYNDALSKGVDTLDKFFAPTGPWGKAGMLLVKGATMYVGAVSKQADALLKSYNDISRSGATAAGGITELYSNMQKFGYGIAELGNMASLVQENAENLALLGGTVFEGTQRFAELSKGIRDSDLGVRFEKMGISVDNQNKGIANYLRLITVTGQQQVKTQEELRAGAEAYVMTQDRLTKLTGASADEQQKIREAALSEERFAASQRQLRRRAEEEGNRALGEEADRREELNTMITKQFGPEAAKAFRDSTAGYLNSPDAQKFLRTFPEARRMIMEGADPKEIQEAMIRGAKATGRITEELGKMGKSAEYTISQAELTRGAGLTALKDSEKTASEQQKVNDASTDSMVGLVRQQRQTRDALQDLVQIGIRPVTAGMEGLAKVIGAIPGVAAKTAATATGGAGGVGGGAGGAAVANADLVKKLGQTGITGRKEQANILAQIQAESGGVAKSENLNYTPQKLLETFPNRIKNLEEAQQLVAQGPEAVGNRIYGGRMGNQANEGFMYRGRGLIQLTGKNNYAKYGKLLGLDLVNNPDLANDPKIAQDIAVAYFNEAKKSGTNLADISSVGRAVGYVDINGQETAKRARMSSELESQIPQARNGGTLSGPLSGYQAMLHGTEAVVPLPNGKSIPVEMPGYTTTLADQTGIMAQQLSKLDELVRVMQSQVSVSNKILQRSS